jgi:hypothetical protein
MATALKTNQTYTNLNCGAILDFLGLLFDSVVFASKQVGQKLIPFILRKSDKACLSVIPETKSTMFLSML